MTTESKQVNEGKTTLNEKEDRKLQEKIATKIVRKVKKKIGGPAQIISLVNAFSKSSK